MSAAGSPGSNASDSTESNATPRGCAVAPLKLYSTRQLNDPIRTFNRAERCSCRCKVVSVPARPRAALSSPSSSSLAGPSRPRANCRLHSARRRLFRAPDRAYAFQAARRRGSFGDGSTMTDGVHSQPIRLFVTIRKKGDHIWSRLGRATRRSSRAAITTTRSLHTAPPLTTNRHRQSSRCWPPCNSHNAGVFPPSK